MDETFVEEILCGEEDDNEQRGYGEEDDSEQRMFGEEDGELWEYEEDDNEQRVYGEEDDGQRVYEETDNKRRVNEEDDCSDDGEQSVCADTRTVKCESDSEEANNTPDVLKSTVVLY